MQSHVGFIGLGLMGRSMVSNLARSLDEVAVWNRTRERANTLEGENLYIASSAAEVAERSDVVFCCVSDDDAVKEVVTGEQGILSAESKPKIVVDCSTIAPESAIRLSNQLKKLSISFLDAPVSGGDVGARDGTLTFMVGGERDAFEKTEPYFDLMGEKIAFMGPSGSGQMTKAINQLIVALSVAAMTEGIVLAERAGLPLRETLAVVASGAAGSWTLDNYAPRVLKGDLKPGFSAVHMLKDLNIALSEADAVRTMLPASKMVRDLYLSFISNGGAELGNHGLIELYRKLLCNVPPKQ